MTIEHKQKPTVAIRLPNELQDFLAKQAENSYRTLSAEIRMRLEQSRRQQIQQREGQTK